MTFFDIIISTYFTLFLCVLSFVFGIAAYYIPPNKKKLAFSVRAISVKPDAPFVYRVAIWNAAQGLLKSDDFAPTARLVLCIGSSKCRTEVIAQSNPACNVRISNKVKMEDRAIEFDYLAHHDGCVIEVVSEDRFEEDRLVRGVLMGGKVQYSAFTDHWIGLNPIFAWHSRTSFLAIWGFTLALVVLMMVCISGDGNLQDDPLQRGLLLIVIPVQFLCFVLLAMRGPKIPIKFKRAFMVGDKFFS